MRPEEHDPVSRPSADGDVEQLLVQLREREPRFDVVQPVLRRIAERPPRGIQAYRCHAGDRARHRPARGARRRAGRSLRREAGSGGLSCARRRSPVSPARRAPSSPHRGRAAGRSATSASPRRARWSPSPWTCPNRCRPVSPSRTSRSSSPTLASRPARSSSSTNAPARISPARAHLSGGGRHTQCAAGRDAGDDGRRVPRSLHRPGGRGGAPGGRRPAAATGAARRGAARSRPHRIGDRRDGLDATALAMVLASLP